MKWIGQHIYDLVARYRSDVYLDDISTGTIASGGNLGLDSNNKIVKAAVSSGGISFDGSTANGVLTYKDADEATVESNLTFDGSTLTLTGDLAVTGDNVTFESPNADDPAVIVRNTANDNQAARFQMRKNRTDAQADNDRVAELDFMGEDAGGVLQQYSKIMVQAVETSDGSETGKMRFQVAEYDGTLTDGLILTGQDADGEIDVTIGAGAASITTTAGHLNSTGNIGIPASKSFTIDGTAILHDASGTCTLREIDALDATTEATIENAIDTLSNLTSASSLATVGTITSGTWQGTALATAYIADDAVTFAKASGVASNIYGNKIKILPSDFATNTDGGNTKFGVGYVNVAGSGYGVRPPNNNTEIFAFVSIPEGMKATHVDIGDRYDLAIEVFEVQIDATTMTSKGTGNCNTTLDITDVNSTATNMLAIEITTTSVNDRIYGGSVTIAPI